MIFKDAVVLPPHSLFCILSQQIAPDSTSSRSYATGWQGTINSTFKIFLVAIFILNNDNTAIAVGKAVNGTMKLINGI